MPQALGAPVEVGATLDVATAKAWRAWLRTHHRSAREIWLVFARKGHGAPRISYNDAVDEALCWGWIDSVVKPLPGGLRAQRFTPRRPGSRISELNKARVRRLVAGKRMTRAGLAALPDHAAWLEPPPLRVPRDIRAALAEDPAVWRAFQDFPEAYRRIRVGWVDDARSRPEVFQQRLRHLVRMTRKGKRFGMIQE